MSVINLWVYVYCIFSFISSLDISFLIIVFGCCAGKFAYIMEIEHYESPLELFIILS